MGSDVTIGANTGDDGFQITVRKTEMIDDAREGRPDHSFLARGVNRHAATELWVRAKITS